MLLKIMNSRNAVNNLMQHRYNQFVSFSSVQLEKILLYTDLSTNCQVSWRCELKERNENKVNRISR